MQFADPKQRANAYLILRHLYDGDVIEWPVDDAHPLRRVFDELERQGYVARWDRVWPLHDRYRLTEAGIAAIEAVYRPADAERVWSDLRGRNMRVAERRVYLTSYGYDPFLWCILHDHSVYWDTYYDDPGLYYNYVWEDDLGYRTRYIDDGPIIVDGGPDVIVEESPPYTMDLDRDAQGGGPDMGMAGPQSDYDVS